MQIATVLKRGPEFRPEHLKRLVNTIRESGNDHKIICLTDFEFEIAGVDRIPLIHFWPGWWSKIELFRVATEPTLYLDIDTVVVGRLPEIGPRFAMIEDVYDSRNYGSGVMSWQKAPRNIYDTFKSDADRYMRKYRTRQHWGDQAFIRDYLGHKPDLLGNEFRSYKAHCKRFVPHETKVVYFHGKPRPWFVRLRFPGNTQ